jgi:hypothetical protein
MVMTIVLIVMIIVMFIGLKVMAIVLMVMLLEGQYNVLRALIHAIISSPVNPIWSGGAHN